MHGPGDMHVKFDAPPMSREPSPASSSMTPTTSHKSSRFSVEKEQQQQQQQQQSSKEQGVCDPSTMSPECRKKGRFELTGGNTSTAVVNEKAEGIVQLQSTSQLGLFFLIWFCLFRLS